MATLPHFYTADEVAERLNMHVKTIRRYIRDGRLRAKRIGKEYRITRTDLDEFAGSSQPVETAVPRTRQVIASSILDVDAISPDESHRITTLVMASLNARKGEPDFPRVDSIYYPGLVTRPYALGRWYGRAGSPGFGCCAILGR